MNGAPAYAGFWKRFLAFLIDAILLSIVNFVIFLPVIGMMGLGAGMSGGEMEFDPENPESTAMAAAMMGGMVLAGIATTVAGWLYFALMESSAKGATLGKRALGIKVTDMSGNRISFGRATGRYFGKIVSGVILYIGFLMAGFTQQKQALHDIMASCLVVNSR
jgi:uncharacterized RDD family membrane protein YckC